MPVEIRGVKEKYIDKILFLIQDKFPSFNAATYFLEHNLGIENDIGFTNLRDFLSHILLIVSKKEADELFYENQLALAEEHIRRAIVEPFELAATMKIDSARDAYEFYQLNISNQYNFEPSEIEKNNTYFNQQFARIYDLMRTGREKKTTNVWDSDWEEGIKIFVEAYELANTVCGLLTQHNKLIERYNLEKKTKVYFWWGIIATVGFGITGIALGILALL